MKGVELWLRMLGKQKWRVLMDFDLQENWKRQKKIKKWNKEVFGLVRERIKALQANITEIRQKPPTKENLELEVTLNLEFDDWLTKEELRWKQKSRALWLKEGDRNSRFFHLSTLIRRRRNRIS